MVALLARRHHFVSTFPAIDRWPDSGPSFITNFWASGHFFAVWMRYVDLLASPRLRIPQF